MKFNSAQWGEYMDFCKKYSRMPTDAGFEIYSEFRKITSPNVSDEAILEALSKPVDFGEDFGSGEVYDFHTEPEPRIIIL